MRVHIATSKPITSRDIGNECRTWAEKNLPEGTILTNDMNECDVFFSVLYNKLISEKFITSRQKCFNFHAGILPDHRGSGTINWVIINREKESGVTLHEIDPRIDHGPIIEIRKFPITETDTAETVFAKTEDTILQMFQDWFIHLIQNNYTAHPQDHSKAKIYLREDLQYAKNLTRFARAFHLPGREQSYYFNKKGKKKYLIY